MWCGLGVPCPALSLLSLVSWPGPYLLLCFGSHNRTARAMLHSPTVRSSLIPSLLQPPTLLQDIALEVRKEVGLTLFVLSPDRTHSATQQRPYHHGICTSSNRTTKEERQDAAGRSSPRS